MNSTAGDLSKTVNAERIMYARERMWTNRQHTVRMNESVHTHTRNEMDFNVNRLSKLKGVRNTNNKNIYKRKQ